MSSIEKLPSRYKIERKLGEGGFGEVFEAYDSHLQQAVAIKVFPDNTATTPDTLKREFETLSKLQHPNLVRVFDYGILPPQTPYFTMELVTGENLKDFLKDRASITNLPTIIKQTLNALAYLSKNRILHGDIKPENIVITRNKQDAVTTRLLDFGLSTSFGDQRKLLSGTIRYLAPEILLTGASKSPATDIYALGVSLVESILTRELPRAECVDEVFLENAYSEITSSLTSASVKNPSALSSFILDLCRPNPADRMHDATEASRALELIGAEVHQRPELPTASIFVGRKIELARIGDLLTSPQAEKRVIVLSGPPGAGKKSILWKAVQNAQIKGFLPIDLTPSSRYFSLDKLTGRLGSYMSAEDRKHFLSILPAWSKSKRLPMSADVAPDKATVIFAHIIDFLTEMSVSQPVLITISDIDSCSEDLLSFVLQLVKQIEGSQSRISLLMTSNTELPPQAAASDALTRIGRSPILEMLEVPTFNDDLLRQYLAACFGRTLLPERERQDLINNTQGLPLLIAAFLKTLVAREIVQNEDGYWILDRKLYKQVRIPIDLDHSLADIIRDASAEELEILRILSLSGPASAEQLISIMSGILKDPEPVLAHLLGKPIVVRRKDETISLAHPLFLQFIIENIPAERLREYSGRLAEWLISRGSSDSLRISQLCITAERLEEALKYGFDAVEKMYSSYMLFDCLKLLTELKSLVAREGNKSQLVSVIEKLAPMEHRAGLVKEALEHYVDLVHSSQSQAQKTDYYIKIAEMQHDSLGNIKDAGATLRKALLSARRSGRSDLVAAVYQKLGATNPERRTAYHEKAATLSKKTNVNLYLTSLAHLAYAYQISGNLRRAQTIQRTILGEMSAASNAAKQEIYFFLYWISFYSADYKAARTHVLKKIQLEKKTEDPSNLIISMSSLGGCYYTEGSYYRMIDTLREAYRTALRYDNYVSAVTILANLSLGYRSIADYGQSMRMLCAAEDIITREAIQALNTTYLSKPAMLYLMLGGSKRTEFETFAGRLHERAATTRNRIGLGHHSMAFALYHMNRLEPAEALLHAKKALAYFRKAADRDDVVHALLNIAIIHTSQGKPKLAATNLKEAEELYQAIHCEYLKPQLLLAKGMLARVTQADDAGKVLTEALRTSKKMGTREITWQIQRELALYHKGRGEPHKALASYRDAVETIKQITETIDEEELRMSYLEVPFRKRIFDEIKTLR